MRTLVLCRQAGSSAPSTPEPSGRQGQTQSLRVDPCWQPAEPRGRSTTPRRRPTYYTVTVPTSCILTPGPVCCSGSDDSISDLSSVSHTTSPGSSSPNVSFAVPLPLAEPGYPRGALQLLPPAAPLTFLYEQDLAPLRYQRLVPSRSRIVRTPSLKDYAPAGARGLSKAAVTEELKSWHQRARLRGARPHSLDRQGALLRPHGGITRDMPVPHGVLSLVQGPPVQVLRRSAGSVPIQVYMSENSEIVTQVPKTIAGIASAVVLFIAIVTTIVCCFMCSCCYLYQRRQHPRTPCKPGFTPMAMYPPPDPAAHYPMYPSGPPVYNPAAPPPYVPAQPSYPGA
ncbi:hypothetical protein DUI87_24259 [Hirundo rustica rustica]|uniref:Protein shisa-4 n=1 Tax=Hirundo rustica rustica TaxID=333673 RepID=A0A3M0JEZ0_HIRRU|nr:hypothetical protein DUI87_24259 [Hirundo rustica rustica]